MLLHWALLSACFLTVSGDILPGQLPTTIVQPPLRGVEEARQLPEACIRTRTTFQQVTLSLRRTPTCRQLFFGMRRARLCERLRIVGTRCQDCSKLGRRMRMLKCDKWSGGGARLAADGQVDVFNPANILTTGFHRLGHGEHKSELPYRYDDEAIERVVISLLIIGHKYFTKRSDHYRLQLNIQLCLSDLTDCEGAPQSVTLVSKSHSVDEGLQLEMPSCYRTFCKERGDFYLVDPHNCILDDRSHRCPTADYSTTDPHFVNAIMQRNGSAVFKMSILDTSGPRLGILLVPIEDRSFIPAYGIPYSPTSDCLRFASLLNHSMHVGGLPQGHDSQYDFMQIYRNNLNFDFSKLCILNKRQTEESVFGLAGAVTISHKPEIYDFATGDNFGGYLTSGELYTPQSSGHHKSIKIAKGDSMNFRCRCLLARSRMAEPTDDNPLKATTCSGGWLCGKRHMVKVSTDMINRGLPFHHFLGGFVEGAPETIEFQDWHSSGAYAGRYRCDQFIPGNPYDPREEYNNTIDNEMNKPWDQSSVVVYGGKDSTGADFDQVDYCELVKHPEVQIRLRKKSLRKFKGWGLLGGAADILTGKKHVIPLLGDLVGDKIFDNLRGLFQTLNDDIPNEFSITIMGHKLTITKCYACTKIILVTLGLIRQYGIDRIEDTFNQYFCSNIPLLANQCKKFVNDKKEWLLSKIENEIEALPDQACHYLYFC